MDPNTKVYFLITSGNDGSYIAGNFVSRHELPKYEKWPYTYSTMALILDGFETELPMNSIADEEKFKNIALKLLAIWEDVIADHVFDSKNMVSIDPITFVKKNPKMLTPTKLKIAEYMLQIGSEKLHIALEDENKSTDEKLSLMKDIYDHSKAFLDKKNF